jgi:NAD(P)H-dependent FMN reductase
MISFAEHNGSYTAAFKNLYDWMSRIDMKVYQGKPVVMLATSPAGRGGAGVLATATSTAPHFGADVRGSLSVPRFHKSFDAEAGRLVDDDLEAQLREVVSKLVDGGGA